MQTNRKEFIVPKVQPVKFVEKGNGVVKGYAVNTFHGMFKDYNEDRVSIIMNITKPNYKGRWPKCSYFGVFDGHGGDHCSNFLKDNMHRYITENQYFPTQPIEALKAGFKRAQAEFIRYAETSYPPQRSGSCALVILIIDEICYIANVGDSRAILSSQRGTKIYSLSYDHKPDSPMEKTRIEKAGGKIYQSMIKGKNGVNIPGPHRINPGKLSVSRSFGDIEAKLEIFGGNPKVLIAKPEITYFQINPDLHDFIVMGSDGIFDKLTNQEVAECFWQRHDNRKNSNQYIGQASSKILTESMNKMSMDNITSLIIVFEDYGRLQLPRKKSVKYSDQLDMQAQKQNKITERELNSLTIQRAVSNKLIQKMTMRRKSTTNPQSSLHQSSKNIKNQKQLDRDPQRGSTKNLRKDNTMKVLPTHKADKTQIKEDNQLLNSMTKMLKYCNIEKIR